MKTVASMAAAVLLLLAGQASAQNNPGTPGIGVLRGTCLKLASPNGKGRCKGEVASVVLDDGSVTFIFTGSNGKIGFRGNGQAVRPRRDGAAILPVFFVMIGDDGYPAPGSCTYSDPFSGRPATIECSVESTVGKVEGSFRSNGQPPMMQRLSQ